MTVRCAKHFVKGALMRYPAPFNRDFPCWLAGLDFLVSASLVMAPIALVGIGIVIGINL